MKNPKTRGNYPVRVCLKKCANRGKKCDKCIKWSEYKEIKDEESKATA